VKLTVSPTAVADIRRVLEFLAEKNPLAAQRAAAALDSAIRSLAVSPDRGRPARKGGFRELVVPFGRAAYVVRYAHPSLDEIVILRIWHSREGRD
jgi:plasmid stabilization system protein ParE